MPKNTPATPLRELGDLVREIERREALRPDQAFVLWFVRSHLLEDEEDSRQCLTGRTNEKGLDAIYLDHPARQVNLIQGKFRITGAGKPESRGEVLQLAQFGRILADRDSALDQVASTANPTVRDRLLEARNLVRRKGYSINLYFVTTGTISKRLIDDAEEIAKGDATTFFPIHGKNVERIIADYIFDAAPAVPSLELDISSETVLGRRDEAHGIDSYIFSMKGKDVGDLLRKAGKRLFARNIRGFLGKQADVNRTIAETLSKEPNNFWYFNNGVTLICDQAQDCGTAGRPRLRVKNPQVINGQQTTYMLNAYGTRESEVLVRVIAIPRENPEDFDRFNDLVSEIVTATNRQSKISASDLKANDPEQIRIERELRKRNVLYVRKRVGKAEARSHALIRAKYVIRKEELAQSVGAAMLDPYYVRAGKEILFEGDVYAKIFPSGREITEYLSVWHLNSVARRQARGNYLSRYGRWLAINFLWDQLREPFRSKAFREKFIYVFERDWQYPKQVTPLYIATRRTYAALRKFYRQTRATNDGYLDESTFFKYRNRHDQFSDFFWSRKNPDHEKVSKSLRDFVARLQAFEP